MIEYSIKSKVFELFCLFYLNAHLNRKVSVVFLLLIILLDIVGMEEIIT